MSRQYISKLVQGLPQDLQPYKKGRAKLLKPDAQLIIRNKIMSSKTDDNHSTAIETLREQLDTKDKQIAKLIELTQSQSQQLEKLQELPDPDKNAADKDEAESSHAETSNESTSSNESPTVDRQLTLGERLKVLFSGHLS